MEVTLNWRDGMAFTGNAAGHEVPMDAKSPIGKGAAPTPKELVALGLGGCTAMDVIALLKKHKQPPTAFETRVNVTTSTGKNPAVFENAEVLFVVEGAVEPSLLLESVELSQTKYCGVSAMLLKAFPITYRVELNGAEIGRGEARFE